jgi:hypothetical protein
MKTLLTFKSSVKSLGRIPLALAGVVLGTLLAMVLVLPSVAGGQAAGAASTSESPALPGIRTIVTAERTYSAIYKRGYSRNLSELGETPAGTRPSASRANLIDYKLARGEKNGYVFVYEPGHEDNDGQILDYTLSVRPSRWQMGRKSFFTDQTGVIHETTENREATGKDQESEERVLFPPPR